MRLEKQVLKHPKQDLSYQVLPVNRKNNTWQYFTINRFREMTRLTKTTTELYFETKFIGLNLHPLQNSTQIKCRFFASLFVVTSLQFTSTDDPLFGLQWGNRTF